MSGNLSFIAIVAAIGGGISLFLLLRAAFAGPSGATKKRLARVRYRGREKDIDEQQATLRRADENGFIPGLDKLVKWLLPRPALLRLRLQRTGRKISLGEYALICFVVGGVFGVIAHQFLGRILVVSILSAISSGLIYPHLAITYLINRRLKAFTAEFPEAIDLIVRGLKSGLPVPESIRSVGEEMKDPLGIEFRAVAEKVKLGMTLEESLQEVALRIPTPEYRFFVISISVQRETGGNLAETLENLSDILRKRRQMRLKIKAMSSEANASAMILGSLPFALFGVLCLLNFEYVSALFNDPRGNIMLGAALGSLGLGIAVMKKMARFEI